MDTCKLPQELVDIIIDNINLDNSPWTLSSCSLVCRSWLPRTHRHFFYRIVLRPPKRPGDVSYSMRLYRVLLNSPHITNYIRELVVYEGHRLKGQDWIGIDQTLPLVLRRLTNLTTIEFRGLYWNVLPPDLMRSIRYVFQLPSLTFVDIHDARFANIDDFASLLCHTKGLTRLSLAEINIMEPQPHEYHEVEEEEQMLDSHRRRHIVNLHLALYNYPIFVGWLLQSPAEVSHIHTLHISGARQPHDENAINRLLRAIGSSLKHFHFCLPWSLFRFSECP